MKKLFNVVGPLVIALIAAFTFTHTKVDLVSMERLFTIYFGAFIGCSGIFLIKAWNWRNKEFSGVTMKSASWLMASLLFLDIVAIAPITKIPGAEFLCMQMLGAIICGGIYCIVIGRQEWTRDRSMAIFVSFSGLAITTTMSWLSISLLNTQHPGWIQFTF